MYTENRNTSMIFHSSLQETYEAKRNEFMGELQKKEEEMRQMFVQRVKEKEAELKEAEKEVPVPVLPSSCREFLDQFIHDVIMSFFSTLSYMRNLTV